MPPIYPCLIVFISGGAGSVLRYLSVLCSVRLFGDAFPLGTLFVNLIGSFAIGAIAGATASLTALRDDLKLACVVGLLGGFTTFSAFAWDTLRLNNQSGALKAIVYVALTNVLGLLLAWVGYRLALSFSKT